MSSVLNRSARYIQFLAAGHPPHSAELLTEQANRIDALKADVRQLNALSMDLQIELDNRPKEAVYEVQH